MEAIFASFLLLTSILLCVQLFDSSLQAEASNEQRVTAALVAESALAEIRAATTENFEGLLASYGDRRWSLTNYPTYDIQATVTPQTLAAPCSELESQYTNRNAPFPQPRPRLLEDSVWKVQLDVSWSKSTADSISVVEYFASLKPIANFEVTISPPGGTTLSPNTTGTFNIARNRTLDFRAQATSGGRRVRDVQFSWYVEPLDGFGSVYRVSRDGTRCRYRNSYRNSNRQIRHSPGQCDLVVKAVYQGVEAIRKVRIANGA